jgi:hypothetical protein
MSFSFLEVSAGKGTVIGQDEFLTYTDNNADEYVGDITAVTVATGYDEKPGLWKIPVAAGTDVEKENEIDLEVGRGGRRGREKERERDGGVGERQTDRERELLP